MQSIFKTNWRSPSNIALIKYWGKYDLQLPQNPSLSLSLSSSYTETHLSIHKKLGSNKNIGFLFEGKEEPAFAKKIELYFDRLKSFLPWIDNYDYSISSRNSFPHSAGIASSASAMSALALGLAEFDLNQSSGNDFKKRASELARIGSGSACRSVYGGYALWGQHQGFDTSSNEFAIDVNEKIHPVFTQMCDSIMIVDAGAKKVSSSLGHALMNEHAFAESRFKQARHNLDLLWEALISGNVNNFGRVVESEALSLHAMMMTASESFMLMKPNTLNIIEHLVSFRERYNIPVCFTLDAGPNVHILYPEEVKSELLDFIGKELVVYCEQNQWIDDALGTGPVKIFKKVDE